MTASGYQNPVYDYQPAPEQQDDAREERYPVIVVGAGPVGLSAAIDLMLQDIPAVLLDEDNTVSSGSRAICFAKRTLEIMDRLGCGDAVVDKGITWNLGRVYFKNKEIYKFNLLAQPGHKRPAFINLQQYYFEHYLVEKAQALALDLRWQNKVIAIKPAADHIVLDVETPAGVYSLSLRLSNRCRWCQKPVAAHVRP